MDLMVLEREESVQETRVQYAGEVSELEQTVLSLREELEINTLGYEDKIRELQRDAQVDQSRLQETILVLREQMEQGNE